MTDNRQQAISDEDSSGARMKALLTGSGRDLSWLARETGVARTTLADYARDGVKGARNAVAIARALGVNFEWLMTGVRTDFAGNPSSVLERDDWIELPLYRIGDFDSAAKPAIAATVPMHRELISRTLRVVTNIWLTEMPSNALPDVAREGDAIVCRDEVFDAAALEDQRIYLFLVDGRPIVRRLVRQPGEVLLTTSDAFTPPMAVPLDEVGEGLVILGRVVGAFSLHAV